MGFAVLNFKTAALAGQFKSSFQTGPNILVASTQGIVEIIEKVKNNGLYIRV